MPTLFLIDDDEVEHKLIARMLKKYEAPYALVGAHDGQTALDLLTDGQVPSPHLILLDLNMPCMDGFEFLDRLAENPAHRNAPVFVLSTSETADDRARAWTRNIAGYFVKPVDPNEYEKWCRFLLDYLAAVRFPA